MKLLLPITLFVFYFFVLTAEQSKAYEPPLGIPDPGFGIDDIKPSRPVDWNSEIAGYYYINQETGINTGRPNGTPNAPRATFPSPIPAGSYVEVHGEYTSGNNIILTGNGNGLSWVAGVSGPVWIVGENEVLRPNITRKIVVTGTYIFFDTLKFTAPGLFQVSSPTAGYPADYIVLRNSEVEGSIMHPSSAVGVAGASTSTVSNVVIYNNYLHDAGDLTIASDQDSHMTTVGNYSSNIWFLNNTFLRASGSGTQLGGSDNLWATTNHIYFGKNDISYTRAAGLAVKHASDVVFSENIIHDIIDTRPLYDISASESKGIGFQYEPMRLWIINNEIYNCGYGIRGVSTDGGEEAWSVYIIGNIIHDTAPENNPRTIFVPDNGWSYSAISLAGMRYGAIINNTIHRSNAGIYIASSGAFDIENNIISEVTTSLGRHVLFENSISSNQSIFRNNIVYQSDRDEFITWPITNINKQGNLAYIQTETTAGDECISDNPKFLDIANEDLRLQKDSPAIDKGVTNDVYTTFYSAYGLDIKKDIDGNARPSVSAWDIGAYEYQMVIRGDVDNSSTTNTTDALLTLRNSLGLSMTSTAWQTSATTGDVDCNGVSNSTDALLILRYSLGLNMTSTAWCEGN